MDTPTTPPEQTPNTPAPKTEIGPFVGIIIILAVLVFGALYFWGAKLQEEQITPLAPSTETETLSPETE